MHIFKQEITAPLSDSCQGCLLCNKARRSDTR